MRWLTLILFLVAATVSYGVTGTTFVWTGAAGDGQYNNPANWSGGAVPPNDGSAAIVFGNTGAGTVNLPFALNVDRIEFSNSSAASYTFNSAFLTILTVHNGVSASTGESRFNGNVILNLEGDQTFSVAGGSLKIEAAIIGNSSLNKTGTGTLQLSGLNLYTGGTHVETGAILFNNAAAVPEVGTITSAAGGYVGVTFTNNVQSGFIDHINASSFKGSIGLDTSSSQSTPAIFTETIDVRDLKQFAGLGSSTSAVITGKIQISQGQDYRFSGGDGTLYVESGLTANGSSVQVVSASGTPLTVYLRGNNTFSGSLNILNSVVVLDSNAAMHTQVLNLNGPGYLGSTERYPLSPNALLGRVGNIGSTNAIFGIDSVNVSAPRTITENIDLSVGGTRTDPYYLGTSTKVIITGLITPTVGDSLYLTAVKGGHLVVNSHIGTNVPSVVIGQTNSFDPQGGTVELGGINTYTGGTRVLGGTLLAASNTSLSTSLVDVANRATLSVAANVLISNPVSLSSGSRLTGFGGFASPGGVTIGNGATLAPGGNAIGTLSFTTGLTLAGGGLLDFNVNRATGQAGANWDFLNVSGSTLNLTATSTNPFTINLLSLTPNGVAGSLTDFNSNQNYSWTFANAGTITGFSSDQFLINTTGFLSNLNGGSFFITQSGSSLSLNFTPVPEPSTYALMALGLGVIALVELRRRKK